MGTGWDLVDWERETGSRLQVRGPQGETRDSKYYQYDDTEEMTVLALSSANTV